MKSVNDSALNYVSSFAIALVAAVTCVGYLAQAASSPNEPRERYDAVQHDSRQALADADGRVESILGYSPDGDGISFQVSSGGCTSKEDFRVQVVKGQEPTQSLSLIRLHPDSCRSFVPTGQRIYLTYGEMGLNPMLPFTLRNPNGPVLSWVWNGR